jgi:hypothetical protein
MAEMPTPQFLTFQFIRTEKTFYNLNPFYITKESGYCSGKVKNVNCLRNGGLLVQVLNEKQYNKLMKTSLLGSYLKDILPSVLALE